MSVDWLHVNPMGSTNWRLAFGNTYYAALSGRNDNEPLVEADYELIVRDTSTLKNLLVNVRTNSSGSGTAVIVARKNGADTALTLSVAAATTGVFEDTTNTVSLASGDRANYKMTDSYNTGNWRALFSSLLVANGTPLLLAADDTVSIGAGTTNYMPVSGKLVTPLATETQAEYTIRSSATLSKLRVFVNGNSSSTGTRTVRTRKNQANGGQSVSITAVTTGAFEDASNTDSVVAGDEVDYQAVGGNDFSYSISAIQLKSTAAVRPLICNPQLTIAADDFWPVEGGRQSIGAAESAVKTKTRVAFTAQNLFCECSANTTTVMDLYVRQNGANTTMKASFGSGVTGIIEDLTHTVAFAATDDINYFADITSGASILVRTIAIEQADAAAAGITPQDLVGTAGQLVPRRRPMAIAY